MIVILRDRKIKIERGRERDKKKRETRKRNKELCLSILFHLSLSLSLSERNFTKSWEKEDWPHPIRLNRQSINVLSRRMIYRHIANKRTVRTRIRIDSSHQREEKNLYCLYLSIEVIYTCVCGCVLVFVCITSIEMYNCTLWYNTKKVSSKLERNTMPVEKSD